VELLGEDAALLEEEERGLFGPGGDLELDVVEAGDHLQVAHAAVELAPGLDGVVAGGVELEGALVVVHGALKLVGVALQEVAHLGVVARAGEVVRGALDEELEEVDQRAPALAAGADAAHERLDLLQVIALAVEPQEALDDAVEVGVGGEVGGGLVVFQRAVGAAGALGAEAGHLQQERGAAVLVVLAALLGLQELQERLLVAAAPVELLEERERGAGAGVALQRGAQARGGGVGAGGVEGDGALIEGAGAVELAQLLLGDQRQLPEDRGGLGLAQQARLALADLDQGGPAPQLAVEPAQHPKERDVLTRAAQEALQRRGDLVRGDAQRARLAQLLQREGRVEEVLGAQAAHLQEERAAGLGVALGAEGAQPPHQQILKRGGILRPIEALRVDLAQDLKERLLLGVSGPHLLEAAADLADGGAGLLRGGGVGLGAAADLAELGEAELGEVDPAARALLAGGRVAGLAGEELGHAVPVAAGPEELLERLVDLTLAVGAEGVTELHRAADGAADALLVAAAGGPALGDGQVEQERLLAADGVGALVVEAREP
jgi:hypothetical protein